MQKQKVNYKLVEKKWGISVYAGDTLTAMIDNEFAQKFGYNNAMAYCKKVFLNNK